MFELFLISWYIPAHLTLLSIPIYIDEVFYAETKHHSYEYLVNYGLNLYFDFNLSSKIRLESTNFIIEISKFHWIRPSTDANRFIGLYEKINEQKFPAWIAHIDETNYNCDIKTIITAACNPPELFAECYLPNPSTKCNKPNQYDIKINNWEGKVYECNDLDKIKKLSTTLIAYKCEVFISSDYNNTFKSQYDKFFEGVRLK